MYGFGVLSVLISDGIVTILFLCFSVSLSLSLSLSQYSLACVYECGMAWHERGERDGTGRERKRTSPERSGGTAVGTCTAPN